MMNRGAVAASCVLAVSLAFSLAFSLTGCLTEPEPELGTEAQEAYGCPYWGCGENTPHMESWTFHELDEDGTPNAEGIRLLDMRKGSLVYHPNVIGARLVGESPGGGTISGSQLVGAYLQLLGPDGRPYRIYITAVSNEVRHWIGPFESSPIETYELWYTNVTTGTTRPICRNPPSRYDSEGHFWVRPLEAMLFTGDRYDVTTKTVTAANYRDAGTTFTFACAGSALAKLHLNRHTTAGSTSTRQTNLAQRQTLLKMYVSDVCGLGNALTVAGTPLHWQNTTNWSTLTGSEASIEGFWGPNGAVCIEDHRLSPTHDGFIAGCVPKCSAVMPFWPAGWPSTAYIKTANP